MNIRAKRFWLQIAALTSICVFPCRWFWAQNEPASAGKPETSAAVTSATQAADVHPDKPHDDSFVIGNDDVLAVNVWREPDISRSIPVRSDGKISLPLVGEVQAAGQTPRQLEEEIAAK